MQRILSACVLLLAVVVIYGQYERPVNVPQLCKTVSNRIGSHFVRHPTNCSRMYNCDGDLSFPVMMNCQLPLVFSQAHQVCVYKNGPFDDCGKRVFQGGFNSPICRARPSGMNKDPEHCNRFVPCWKGNAFPSMPCQGNLMFSFQGQRCVEPGKVQCNIRPNQPNRPYRPNRPNRPYPGQHQ